MKQRQEFSTRRNSGILELYDNDNESYESYSLSPARMVLLCFVCLISYILALACDVCENYLYDIYCFVFVYIFIFL